MYTEIVGSAYYVSAGGALHGWHGLYGLAWLHNRLSLDPGLQMTSSTHAPHLCLALACCLPSICLNLALLCLTFCIILPLCRLPQRYLTANTARKLTFGAWASSCTFCYVACPPSPATMRNGSLKKSRQVCISDQDSNLPVLCQCSTSEQDSWVAEDSLASVERMWGFCIFSSRQYLPVTKTGVYATARVLHRLSSR